MVVFLPDPIRRPASRIGLDAVYFFVSKDPPYKTAAHLEVIAMENDAESQPQQNPLITVRQRYTILRHP